MRCAIISSVLVSVVPGHACTRVRVTLVMEERWRPHPSVEEFSLRLSGERLGMTLPWSRVERDETGAQCVQRKLRAIAHPELAEHVAQMRFDGFLADEELPRDVAVLQPHRDVAHDFELTGCETLPIRLAHAAG